MLPGRMPTLEFFYDIASPYTYLASTQIEAIASDCGATLVWRPFLLGAVFKLTGNQPPAMLPARGSYMHKDLERWKTYYRVPLTVPASFPPNSLKAMRVLVSTPTDQLADLTHRLFHAYWAEGKDIGDPAMLETLVGAEAMARTNDPAVKQLLKDVTGQAVSRGAFGAPTFFIGDNMFFGNDRLPFVEQMLRNQKRN